MLSSGKLTFLAILLLWIGMFADAPAADRTPEALAGAVTTKAASADDSVDFVNHVQPILTRYGCTSGPCHGKARGQGGFQLSLLGFDHNFDYDAITKDARGRRIFAAAPDQSLLLTKPTGHVPHGGGIRIAIDSPEYQTLLTWIEQGASRAIPGTPELAKLTVEPNQLTLKNGASTQLSAIAYYDDGSTRDVTRLAAFQSNESPIAAVDESGMVTAGTITGDAAVMARFHGHDHRM